MKIKTAAKVTAFIYGIVVLATGNALPGATICTLAYIA